MAISKVILVDERDREIGSMEKIKAHQDGVLHRAFSVFLFNNKKELLMQKRAISKYHSGGLWSNTCCSHPAPGQSLQEAVNSALQRELGILCAVNSVGSFIYKKELGNGLIEHEYDHLFVGNYDGSIKINPEEVDEIKYMNVPDILKDVKANSENYTAWFSGTLEIVIKKL